MLSNESQALHGNSAPYTTFPLLISGVLDKYPDARVFQNTLVFQEQKCFCRVDCGPCLIDSSESEIRVVVGADSPDDNCGEVADAVAASLCSYDDDPSKEWRIKVCCRWCHNYYLELDDLKRAGNERKPCVKCNEILQLDNLRHGYKQEKELRRKRFAWDIHPGISGQCSSGKT